MEIQDTNVNDNLVGSKKRFFWIILFVIIALASIFAIVGFNKSFSFTKFIEFFKSSDPLWMGLAVLSMVMFIFTEGCAIKSICSSFKYKTKLRDGFAYSSADIYFSAITPSATGGQPASAYFMHKDGISLPVITVTMFCILMMYSLSILIINVVCFLISPSILLEFNLLSKVIMIIGVGIQFVLIAFFYFLLFNETLLYKICNTTLNILSKLHLVKNKEAHMNELNRVIKNYKESASMLKGHSKVLIKTFIFIFLQRVSQIGVIVCVFIATGGSISNAFAIWTIESFVISGSYCVPIPGAIGVSDYLMLNGFKTLMDADLAVNLELIARGISFYCCILLCGLTVLIKYILSKRSN